VINDKNKQKIVAGTTLFQECHSLNLGHPLRKVPATFFCKIWSILAKTDWFKWIAPMGKKGGRDMK
jgi:hypothetical protein